MLVLVVFCAQLLLCLLFGISIVYPLLIGLLLFTLYGKKCGFSWAELGSMIFTGIKAARNILFVFLLIGILTALWRACGTIPYIICFAVDLIRPGTLILMSFLLNCAVSVLTGTAFGTAATMGTICMSVAVSMGISPLPVGGAILSGVYFGDRCSPVSTSALLVSELTKTNLYSNIRAMVRTAIIPFFISCGIFALLGFSGAGGEAEQVELWALFGQELNLHYLALLPAVLILVLSACRVNVKRAMAASIAAALILCPILQSYSLSTLGRFMLFGFSAENAEVNAMLSGGGILSMVRVAVIVCTSSAYAGIFQKTGLLDQIKEKIVKLSKRTNPFTAMVVTSILTGMVACNQTLTIMLTHQLCSETEESAENEAIDLENSAVVIAPLIPWSIAGGVPLSSVGAPTSSILLTCFLYILPLWILAVKAIKKK